MPVNPEQRAILAGLSRAAKRAAARAYRDGWRQGGDREGWRQAVTVLQEQGLELAEAQCAAEAVVAEAARGAPGWMWRRSRRMRGIEG